MARSFAPLMLFAAVVVPLLALSEGCKSPEGNLPTKEWILGVYGNYGRSDRFGNVIEFRNTYLRISANFECGTDVFKILADCRHEDFDVIVDAEVTTAWADFEVIGSWRYAINVKFDDKSDFVLKLVEHAGLLQKNHHLQKLELNIERQSFDQLNLWPLFATLSGLKQLSIGVNGALTESELRAFHQRQIVPTGFGVRFNDAKFAITYTKRSAPPLAHKHKYNTYFN